MIGLLLLFLVIFGSPAFVWWVLILIDVQAQNANKVDPKAEEYLRDFDKRWKNDKYNVWS